MSNFLDGEFYKNIDTPSKRIAIINTDFTKDDPNWERMEKDVANIKNTLRKLEFDDKNVLELKSLANNVVSKKTKDFCTIDGAEKPHSGYIMMFNLTYRTIEGFRAGKSHFNSEFIREGFVCNYLDEWATKPKFIFYQTPYIPTPSSKTETDGTQSNKTFELPIDADIFESFSNDGDEDSYGNEEGSFYIQAICKIINQHIDDKSIGKICINNIMYEVHAEIERFMVGEIGSQTPHFKSTFIKKFVFPINTI